MTRSWRGGLSPHEIFFFFFSLSHFWCEWREGRNTLDCGPGVALLGSSDSDAGGRPLFRVGFMLGVIAAGREHDMQHATRGSGISADLWGIYQSTIITYQQV